MKPLLNFSLILILLSACSNTPNEIVESQILYYGGDIITMSGDNPNYVESIVSSGDSIVFVGDLSEAKKLFPASKQTNLNGNTLLPGFIDGHAHFAGFPSQSIGAQILPPPDAGANNIDALIKILKEWSTPENIELTGWIFGMGFDDSVLEENRFPTKED